MFDLGNQLPVVFTPSKIYGGCLECSNCRAIWKPDTLAYGRPVPVLSSPTAVQGWVSFRKVPTDECPGCQRKGKLRDE